MTVTELGRTIRGSAETGPEMQLAQNDVEVLDRLAMAVLARREGAQQVA